MTFKEYFDKLKIDNSEGKILGLDVGNTTGVAILHLDSREFSLSELKVIENKKINYAKLWGLLQNTKADLIVVENYVLYGGNKGKAQIGDEILTIRLIGAIELWCYLNSRQCVLYRAIDHKKIGLGIIGKCSDIIIPKGKQHCYDALSLIVYHCVKNRG